MAITTVQGQMLTAPLTLTGNLTFSDGSVQTAAASPYVLKNRIINGAMVIDQRNAGASYTQPVNQGYGLDRWYSIGGVTSKFTMQQNAGSVTPPTGFKNYLGMTSLSSYSIGAGDSYTVSQSIEGFNTADLGFGASGASTVTLSFWVRSSLTGTFGGSLANANALNSPTRSYPFSYTISSANTWEQKSITIAGDTTGTWIGATNGTGLVVNFSMGVGTNYQGTAGAWVTGNKLSVTGEQQIVANNASTLYITGVQLELGTSATPFERRIYGTELAMCQRYFEKSYMQGTAVATGTYTAMILSCPVLNYASTAYIQPMYFKTTKRALPTITFYTYAGTAGQWHTGNIGVNEQAGAAYVSNYGDSAFDGYIAYTVTPNAAYGQYTASAEL